MSLRDSINYLGPGVKHRDDKFLSFLFCSLFKKKERCVILGLDPRIQVMRAPVRQHRQPFVIAREQRDRGDPVNNKVARMRACIIIYWIASLRRAMTKRM